MALAAALEAARRPVRDPQRACDVVGFFFCADEAGPPPLLCCDERRADAPPPPPPEEEARESEGDGFDDDAELSPRFSMRQSDDALRLSMQQVAQFDAWGSLGHIVAENHHAVTGARKDVDRVIDDVAEIHRHRHYRGRTRVIQRRFNVSVPRARVSETAPTLRERSER